MGYSGHFEDTFYPFGHGNLTVGGTQYSTEVEVAIGATYTEITNATLHMPTNYSVIEMAMYLIGSVASASSATGVLSKWQASDDGTNWADLSTAETKAAGASTAYADTNAYSGIATTSANFAMTGNPFYVRFVVSPDSTTAAVAGRTKGSTYIKPKYWLP